MGPSLFFRSDISVLDIVVETPGPLRCLVYFLPNRSIRTTLQRMETAREHARCSSVVWAVSAHPRRIVRYGRRYRSRAPHKGHTECELKRPSWVDFCFGGWVISQAAPPFLRSLRSFAREVTARRRFRNCKFHPRVLQPLHTTRNVNR